MSRDLLLVALALFTWGMGESAFFYFQPLYLEQLGATPIGIGAILGGVGIAMTVAHIPAGYLADRIGRRTLMWAAWLIGLISALIMASAKSLPVFTAGILLYGMTSFVVSPMNSYITAARGKWSVGRVITFIPAAYSAGAVIGPLIGGTIGNRFGLHKIYLFAAWVFLLSNIIIFFIRRQPVEKQDKATSQNGLLNRSFLRYLPLLFMAIFAMYISQPLTPNFLQNENGLSLGEIGTLGAIGSLGNVILSLLLGSLKSQMGFILGQLSTGLFALLLWRGAGLPWFAAGYFLLGGYRAARALAIAQVRALVRPSNMGLAYGIAETVGGTAIILAPPLAGFLYEYNPMWMYQTAIALVIVSIFVNIRFAEVR